MWYRGAGVSAVRFWVCFPFFSDNSPFQECSGVSVEKLGAPARHGTSGVGRLITFVVCSHKCWERWRQRRRERREKRGETGGEKDREKEGKGKEIRK